MGENELATGEAATVGRSTDCADAVSRVVRRLERIEALDRDRAPAGQLLAEVGELVHEAEALARIERGRSPRDDVGKLGEEAEGMR